MVRRTPLKSYSQAALDAMLLQAANECDVRKLRRALKEGANPNARHAYSGRSALMSLGCVPMAFYPDGVFPKESRQRFAAAGMACLNALMQAGANAADAMDNGFGVLHNPFIYAVIPDVVPQLVRAGASATQPTLSGTTPAHVCAAFGPPHIAAWLKQHGADFGAAERLRGEEPLHAAASMGNVPMLAWMIEQGYSIVRPNAEGLSAAQLALRNAGHPDLPGMIDLSVRAGWRPTPQDVQDLHDLVVDMKTHCPASTLRALQRLCVLVCKDMHDEAQRTSLALQVVDAIMNKTMDTRVRLATHLVAEVLHAVAPLEGEERLLETLDRYLLANKLFSEDRLAFVQMLANSGYRPPSQGLQRLHLKLESQIGSDLATVLLAPLHAQSLAHELEALDALDAPAPADGG